MTTVDFSFFFSSFFLFSKLDLVHDSNVHDERLQRRLVDGAEDTEQNNHGGPGDIFRLLVGRWNGSDGGLHPRYPLHR